MAFHTLPSAVKSLWSLVQIPKRDHPLGALANQWTCAFNSDVCPWSNQPGHGGGVRDSPSQENGRCWVSRGTSGWRRYWNLSQRGLDTLQLPPTTHTCTQVCVQPILHPIHMGLAPCRHLAQTPHSKIFAKKQFMFGHSVSPTSRSCLELFPLYQKGLPQLAQPHYQYVDAIASLLNSLRFHFFSGFCNSKLVTSSPPPPPRPKDHLVLTYIWDLLQVSF